MVGANPAKNLIADTLLELCTATPLAKISVGDIARASGLSRQAFYYHFKDKQEVVEWVYLRAFDGFPGEYRDYPRIAEKRARLFEEREEFFLQAFACTRLLSWFEEFHGQGLYDFIVGEYGPGQMTNEVLCELSVFVCGTVRMWDDVVRYHPGISIVDIARNEMSCMPVGLRKYLVPEERCAGGETPTIRGFLR